MIVTVISDVHLFAPNEIRVTFNPSDQSEILLGDVVDMVNCDRKHVNLASAKLELLISKYFDRYILGNHEASSKTNQVYIRGSTVFAHGDFESWGDKKAIAYRSKPHGASWIKRTFLVNAIEFAEMLFDRPQGLDFLKRASSLAKKHNCKKFVCGHFHPRQRVVTEFDGVIVEVVPRGKTEVEVI